MESTIVIKVTYGETLRRFNACVANGELDLDMDGLREKVRGLFNFAPDGDITLTYSDEDGDIVTLVDEEDLRDAMRQSLNPLRMTVSLNLEKSGRSYARSSGSSTPMISPRIQHPINNLNNGVFEILNSVPEPLRDAMSKLYIDLASKATSTAPGLAESPRIQHRINNLNSGVFEILKSVPEPLRDAISKLYIDLASKATSTTPGLAELVDCFSKMGLSYLNRVSDVQTGAESTMQSVAPGRTIGESVSKGPEASKVDGGKSDVLPNAKTEVSTLKNNLVLLNTESEKPNVENNEVNLGNKAGGARAAVTPTSAVDASVTPSTGSVNLIGSGPGNKYLFGSASLNPVPGTLPVAAGNNKLKVEKLDDSPSSGNSDALLAVNGIPVGTQAPAGNKNKEINKPCNIIKRRSDLGGGSDLGHSSASGVGLNPTSGCPFKGVPLGNESTVPQYTTPFVPFNESYKHSDDWGTIFHRGIRCDGCGVHPITGLRFKSKVKVDYDLCSLCFAEMGNEADYIRMDRPMTYRHHLSFNGLNDHPQPFRGFGMKQSRPKLDSRFIQDVNILDGTIMAPSTPFTKIWRMRNNGTLVWPQGTQLLWIGGDKLTNMLSVEVEITAEGFPADKELNIAVDFTAPHLPGRYISYWRMVSPSGQKFGQRVWVLIQVDASLKNSSEIFHGLNLNLPPVSTGITGPEIINVNAVPNAEDNLPEPCNSNRATELVEPMEPIVDANPNKEQELNFPINDTLLVGGGVSSHVPPHPSSSVSYPIIDFSELPAVRIPEPSPVRIPELSPATYAQTSAPGASEKNDVEQTLLKELEEMGFKQVDLNKEILRANEYDLEQSLDDLCGSAAWDPILEELLEMGFCDESTNIRLLKKNNGSIKRVVMDLLAGERE